MNFVLLFPLFFSDCSLLRPNGIMNTLLATAVAHRVCSVPALRLLHARPHGVRDGAGWPRRARVWPRGADGGGPRAVHAVHGAPVSPLESSLWVEADIQRGLQQLSVHCVRGEGGGGGRAAGRHRHKLLVHLLNAPTLRSLIVVVPWFVQQ